MWPARRSADRVPGVLRVVALARLRDARALRERPVGEGLDEVRESAARRRERVRHLRGHRREDRARDEAVAFEAAEGQGPHALRDPVDGALQLAEPPLPRRQLDDDHHRPGVAHAVEHVADPAVGVVLAAARLEIGGHRGVRE
jgi:hypothetical protein